MGQRDLDDEALQNLLADHLLPWYVSFYLSWLEDEDALRITYEDVRTAPVDTVERIMAFAGQNISRDQLELVVSNHQALQKQGRDQKAGSRFKTLSGLTPYDYICKIWTSQPDRFIVDPIHKMPGRNMEPAR